MGTASFACKSFGRGSSYSLFRSIFIQDIQFSMASLNEVLMLHELNYKQIIYIIVYITKLYIKQLNYT